MARAALNNRYGSIGRAFQFMDGDRSGRISRTEIVDALKLLNVPVDSAELTAMLSRCDVNGDGQIDYQEFAALLDRG